MKVEVQKEHFLRDRYLYEDAIMRHVCAHCIDFGADGICHSQDPEGCAVFRFLSEFVAIAERIQDNNLKPYLDAVRNDICMQCRKKGEGVCRLRDTLECGLDRYLPLVLEAVEEVQAGHEKDWVQWRTL